MEGHPSQTCFPIVPISARLLVLWFYGYSSHWPCLWWLCWPSWRFATTCLISSIRLLLSVPNPGLSWTTAFVPQLAVSVLTPFYSRFNPGPSSAALPEAWGMPSVPCRCWLWMCSERACGHSSSAQPSLPPPQGASRTGLAGCYLICHQSNYLTLLVTSTRA